MAKSPTAKNTALRICKTLYELNSNDLHWVEIGEVCRRLDEPHGKSMDLALEYAREQGLLACSPAPVVSVMLTDKGVTAARGKFRKSHRDSG